MRAYARRPGMPLNLQTVWLTRQSDQTGLGAKNIHETGFTGKIQGIWADTDIGGASNRPESAQNQADRGVFRAIPCPQEQGIENRTSGNIDPPEQA